MKGTSSAAQIALSSPATSTCSWRDSTTQGPAIRNSGRSSPTSKPHRFMASDRRDQLGGRLGRIALAAPLMLERRLHEADEQRMTAPRIRRELRVELATEKPRVVRQLDHFHQVASGLAPGPGAH